MTEKRIFSEETGHEWIKGAGGLFAGSSPEDIAKAQAAAKKTQTEVADQAKLDDATARIMKHADAHSEGFTEHLLSGKTPDKGYQVAIPGHALVKPSDQITSADVQTWISKNQDVLSKPNVYMGGWTESKDGVPQLVIEPSENIEDKNTAIHEGIARNQVAIWDNVAGKEIDTGGTGEHNDPLDSKGQKQAGAYHKALKSAYDSYHANGESWVGKDQQKKLQQAEAKKQVLKTTYLGSKSDARQPIEDTLRKLESNESDPLVQTEMKSHTDALTKLPELGKAPLETGHISGAGADGPLTKEVAESRLQKFIDYAKEKGKLGVWKNWYRDANAQIRERATEIDVDPEKFFGMVAASSPRMRWEENGRLKNLDAADKAAKIGKHYEGSNMSLDDIVAREAPEDIGSPDKTPMLSINLKNALRIYYGEHPDSVLRTGKVRSFYNNLRFPGQTNDATMDTWMANAMAGHAADDSEVKQMFGNGTPTPAAWRKYGWSADRVRAVADKNGLTPDETQATVWMALKDQGIEDSPSYLNANPADEEF